MLDYYFEEYKKYIISFFLVLFFSISFLFYFLEDKKIEKKNIIEEEVFIEDKTIGTKTTIFKEKVIQKENLSKINIVEKKHAQILKKEKKKDEVILHSTSSNNNRYSIKLISKKKIKNSNTNPKYIVITGSITDGYSEALFPMSINENYIEDTTILSLEIKDIKNNIKSMCEGYFLDSLSADFSYHMKIEVSEDISDCYIVSQSDFIEEDYFSENKEYVEIKDGVRGILSDKQIKIKNKEKFNKLKISKFLE